MSDRFSHAEMADEIGKLVWSKQTWLDTFSSGPSVGRITTSKQGNANWLSCNKPNPTIATRQRGKGHDHR